MAYDTMVASVETLTEAEKLDLISIIVASLKKDEQSKTGDCSDEYPKGFFNIFGSNPNYELKEPEELDWSLDDSIANNPHNVKTLISTFLKFKKTSC